MSKASPVIQQYLDLKAHYSEHLLFFQMGDFYELFFEDAIRASQALDIALTRRGQYQDQDIPMCGVPLHASQNYLNRLIRQGFSIALCEQLETPQHKTDKGPLKRDIVRIITPGTLTEEGLLDAKSHHFIVCIVPEESLKSVWGIAAIDLSTGDFWTEICHGNLLESSLLNWGPREVILPDPQRTSLPIEELAQNVSCPLTSLPLSRFHPENSRRRLLNFYNVSTLSAFGDFQDAEQTAAGSLLDYVLLTQRETPPALAPLQKMAPNNFLKLDPFTRRNLELTQTLGGEKKGSLLSVIDQTLTPAGGRLLALRLQSPSTDTGEIQTRLESIDFFTHHKELLKTLREHLRTFPDLERPLARLLLGRGSPKDGGMIRDFFTQLPLLEATLSPFAKEAPPSLRDLFQSFERDLTPYAPLAQGLGTTPTLALPLSSKEGGFVVQGYHKELDEERLLANETTTLLKTLEEKYTRLTGITTLKVRENNLIGLFIEVSHAQNSKVPETFALKQSLVQGARYTTPELLDLQERRTGATAKIITLEQTIFEGWVTILQTHQETLRQLAKALAVLDVTTSLAFVAREKKYTKPHIDCSRSLDVQGGFHPVVQETQKREHQQEMVPNDCHLNDQAFTWILTGPNMAGKSTFLRQNALIVLMAQMGSFVPATHAHIGICDRIFSRVGASDNLARGESTFMVEMIETATILRQATPQSLVILDEVGRGTSTHDGLALAWACLEHLVQTHRCRTLFATHYHELTALEDLFPSVQCYTPQVTEWEDQIIFMHKIIRGKAKGSYGLHVARLAGIPESVLSRAAAIQTQLQSPLPATEPPQNNPTAPPLSPLETYLAHVDPENLSPKEALNLLYTLKEQLGPTAGKESFP